MLAVLCSLFDATLTSLVRVPVPFRYATFKNVQSQPGGSHMLGFTRVLHRTQDDALAGEVSAAQASALRLNSGHPNVQAVS